MLSPVLVCAETVNKGDYFAWKLSKDSLAYVDGDFISWRTDDSDDSYEFRQHFIWSDDELRSILKKVKFTNEEIEIFFEFYNHNFTDDYYIENIGKKLSNGNQIDFSASLFELYFTCVLDTMYFAEQNHTLKKLDPQKCKNFYLEAYEASVKKFNAQSSKEYRTYNTYGPLNLPITLLAQRMFDLECRAGKVTPENGTTKIDGRWVSVKIYETDSVATCSYSEETEKYKCVLNRYYNAPYKCTVSCEASFSMQDNDLVFDGNCGDTMVIPSNRPSSLLMYEVIPEFSDIIFYPDKDKKLKKVQKKNKRDY